MDFITAPTYGKIPDYSSVDYNEPKYSITSSDKNILDYRRWRALWAMRCFLDAADNAIELDVVELPYHPLFPKAFIKAVCGYSKNVLPIPLHAVAGFLEDKYGEQIQQPDCDYLLDILQDKQFSIKLPQNAERALKWIEAKKQQLPSWPAYTNREDASEASTTSHVHKQNNIGDTDDLVDINSQEDVIFTKADFGWKEVDELATEVGIISEGKYKLGERKKSAVTGFLDALKSYGIIAKMTQEKLHIIFGDRYEVKVKTDTKGKRVRPDFLRTTSEAIEKRGFIRSALKD